MNSIIVESKEVDANTRRSFKSNSIQSIMMFDSLKDDLFVIQNTCSEKDDSNSETTSNKLVKESSLNSKTKDVHAIKYKMQKEKERCMAYFTNHLFTTFSSFLKQDLKNSSNMESNGHYHATPYSRYRYFVKYTGIEVKHFKDTLLQHMSNVKKSVDERTRHQRQYDRKVNKRQLQTHESKIDTGKVVNDDLAVTESIKDKHDRAKM
ncbi:hypothetical protein Tco_0572514 [Tanacetum coccineum]